MDSKELYEVKNKLLKNNKALQLRPTTRSLSKFYGVSPYKVRKYIVAMEAENFIKLVEKPKSLGRGKWSKFLIVITNEEKMIPQNTQIIKKPKGLCFDCKNSHKPRYFITHENGIKCNNASYTCGVRGYIVSEIRECRDYNFKWRG